ncbi:MAG TPA: hypothetical protein DCX78_00400 [Nitrospina sp.]|jgi:hypothetical protein|nr:hypothetical protein [Nitrospinota bacterium]MDP6335752.1 DUF1566 domain-containing protein [Nitrospinaceae bacterium]HAX45276.1 hypothetical protein [Nitrospina sp.]|tara:strand:- start:5263 stop:5685 length:423 start_codon:yes stop_codon:yes gene_type:complete
MNANIRFEKNGDGTVIDNDTGLIWTQKDSWHIHTDWLTFQEALAWVDELNKKDYLGFHDWRIPEKEEMEKLFVPDNLVSGRSKQELHIDSAFEPGGGNGSWCMPFDQQAAFYFSYTSGISQTFDQDFSQGYLRVVRLYPD